MLNNQLLLIYILGYYILNYTKLYQFIKRFPLVPEFLMDCIVDPIARTIALTLAIDNFKNFTFGAPLLNDGTWLGTNAFVGQWLVGVLTVTSGGIMVNALEKNSWVISIESKILAASSFLYVLFSSQVYWRLFGLDVMHELIDHKIIVTAFSVSFFVLKRCLPYFTNATAAPVEVKRGRSHASHTIVAGKDIRIAAQKSTTSPAKFCNDKHASKSRSSSPIRSTRIGSPVKGRTVSPVRIRDASPVRTRNASPTRDQFQMPLNRRMSTRSSTRGL